MTRANRHMKHLSPAICRANHIKSPFARLICDCRLPKSLLTSSMVSRCFESTSVILVPVSSMVAVVARILCKIIMLSSCARFAACMT